MKRFNFKSTITERSNRRFSESFRIKKVQELESGKVRPCNIQREYEVSYMTISRWKKKYGTVKSKNERIIVETESDTKKNIALEKKVALLERMLGQKQVELDFTLKMIDLAEDHYSVDIKKKFSTEQ